MNCFIPAHVANQTRSYKPPHALYLVTHLSLQPCCGSLVLLLLLMLDNLYKNGRATIQSSIAHQHPTCLLNYCLALSLSRTTLLHLILQNGK
jgi:hypothetical protein